MNEILNELILKELGTDKILYKTLKNGCIERSIEVNYNNQKKAFSRAIKQLVVDGIIVRDGNILYVNSTNKTKIRDFVMNLLNERGAVHTPIIIFQLENMLGLDYNKILEILYELSEEGHFHTDPVALSST